MHKSILISILLGLSYQLSAQKWEAGIFAGASNYAGDLTVGRITLSETHPAIGGFVRYQVNPHFSMRLGAYYGTISGDDKNSDNSKIQLRNLNFQSRIYEIGLRGEWNIAPEKIVIWGNMFTPYLFGGIALFHFNPQTYYHGEWVDLQPLGTEGQYLDGYEDRQYSLYQVSLPLGFGFNYALNDFMSIGLEFGARKTFTDYLDDVSATYVNNDLLFEKNGRKAAALADRSSEVKPGHQFRDGHARGNPGNDDWYMFGGVNLGFKIPAKAQRMSICRF